MTNSYRKDLVGEEDIAFDTNRSNETFERQTSTGEFQIITKVNAKHIPVTNELQFEGAETVQEFLANFKDFVDDVREFIEIAGNWDSYLGEFETEEALISQHPFPSDDAFALVVETQSFFKWDQSATVPEWINLYRGYPTNRVEIFAAPEQTIDWSLGSVFDLGNIIQNVSLNFTNVRQGQEITLNFITIGIFTLSLPISVLALAGASVTFESYNSITIKAVDGENVQEATFYTDEESDDGGGGPGPGPDPDAGPGFGDFQNQQVGSYSLVPLDYGADNDVTVVYIGTANSTFTHLIAASLESPTDYVWIENRGTGILQVVVVGGDTIGPVSLGRTNRYLSPGEKLRYNPSETTSIWTQI